MPEAAIWSAVSFVFAAAVAAITTAVIRIMDRRHGHNKEFVRDEQHAHDKMFDLLRDDIEDLRRRYHQSNDEHAECLRKYERLAGRVDYLENLLKVNGLSFKEWTEHGSQLHDVPEDRTWDGAKRRQHGT